MILKIGLITLFLISFGFSQEKSNSIPFRQDGFSKETLLKKEAYFPENFSIHHSISMGMVAQGKNSKSGGLYLSHLNYEISPSLMLSAAVGFSMVFHSTVNNEYFDFEQDKEMTPELRIPYVALDYQISENSHLRLQMSDGSYRDPFGFYRRPAIKNKHKKAVIEK